MAKWVALPGQVDVPLKGFGGGEEALLFGGGPTGCGLLRGQGRRRRRDPGAAEIEFVKGAVANGGFVLIDADVFGQEDSVSKAIAFRDGGWEVSHEKFTAESGFEGDGMGQVAFKSNAFRTNFHDFGKDAVPAVGKGPFAAAIDGPVFAFDGRSRRRENGRGTVKADPREIIGLGEMGQAKGGEKKECFHDFSFGVTPRVSYPLGHDSGVAIPKSLS